MEKYVRIKEEVELTLSCIDEIRVVPAPKFLYARVLRRIKNRQRDIFEKVSSYVSEPIIAVGLILPVLIFDFQVILQQKRIDHSLPDTAVQSIYQEDYELAVNFYEYDIHEVIR